MVGDQPAILFVHIPKTAGTTFSRIVRLKYGLWPPFNLRHHSMIFGFNTLPTNEQRIDLLRKLRPVDQARVRLYQGHFGFGLHELLPMKTAYVTFLRDPAERIVSMYYMLRHTPNSGVNDLSLEEFVNSGARFERWHIDNGQVRHLAGSRGKCLDVAFGQCTGEHLSQAISNAETHFILVGISERFDESMLVLKRKLGWHSCLYASANVRKSRMKLGKLPEAVLAAIKEHTQLDQSLYDFANRRLDEEIAQYGDSFSGDLERFRRSNRIFGILSLPFGNVMTVVNRTFRRIGAIK